MLVENHFSVSQKIEDLPRLGLLIALPQDFIHAEYSGLGPFDNYRDRLCAAKFGRYSLRADDKSPYIMPQDYGNRSQVRKLLVHNNRLALEIIPQMPMDFSLKDCTIGELQKCYHFFEVQKADKVYLALDLFYRGVGTCSCGPAPFEPHKNLNGGEYDFNFTIGTRHID